MGLPWAPASYFNSLPGFSLVTQLARPSWVLLKKDSLTHLTPFKRSDLQVAKCLAWLSLGTSGAFAAYIKFFMKNGQRYLVETKNLDRFFYKVGLDEISPPLTDSIHCNGYTGLPYRDGWLYKIVTGKITLYNYQPRYTASQFDYIQKDSGYIEPYTRELLKKYLEDAPLAYLDNFSVAEAVIAYNFEKQNASRGKENFWLDLDPSQQDVEVTLANYVDPFILKNYANREVDLWDLLADKSYVQGYHKDPKRALYLYNGLDSLVDNKPWYLKRRQRFSFTVNPLAFVAIPVLFPDGPHVRRLGTLRTRIGEHYGLIYEPLLIRGGQGGFGTAAGIMVFEDDRRFYGSSLALMPEYISLTGENPELRWCFKYLFNAWPGQGLYTGLNVGFGWGFKEVKYPDEPRKKLDRGIFAEFNFDLGFSL